MTPRSTPRDADPLAALTPAEQQELEAASAITPEDVDDAMLTWRQDASSARKDLLDATPDDAT